MFIPIEKCKSGHKNRDSAESVRPAEHGNSVLVGKVLPDIAENRGRRAADEKSAAEVDAHRGGAVARRHDLEESRIERAVEEASAEPEEDAESLTTVGKVVDYLKSKGYGDDGSAPAQ